MKKRFIVILCMTVAVILSSNLTSYGQFALGIRIGYNANKLSTDIDTIKSEFNSGFNASVWAHFGKRLYFAPELRYTLSGGVFTEEGNVSTSGWKQKITVGSMDIPLLLGFKIIHSKAITWRIELGPEMSFVLNEKVKELNDITGPITTSDINSANWFVMAGTGIDVLFLNFDIRYQYGLNAMIKDVSTSTGTLNFNSKNNLISVSVGFKIFGSK